MVISSSERVPIIYLRVNQDKKGTPQLYVFLLPSITWTDVANVYRDSVDVILHERKITGQCPVAVFLALAFADGAFRDISTPEQLFSLRLPEGQHQLPIPWKPEMQNVPIFKQWKMKCNTVEIKCFSRGQFESSLVELSMRAGYESSIKPQHIRRGVANRVDSK